MAGPAGVAGDVAADFACALLPDFTAVLGELVREETRPLDSADVAGPEVLGEAEDRFPPFGVSLFPGGMRGDENEC